MYKTIIRFGVFDIQNNQGRGRGYQPQPSGSAYNPYLPTTMGGMRNESLGTRLRDEELLELLRLRR